jgi:DNA polymerase-4
MRKILHIDLDAFFCAVEELRQPELKGKPFAVGGRPNERGVVSSCSYPARRYGIHSAMPMAQALQLCPGLIIVPPDHQAYEKASQRVMAILCDLTPLVEQVSIDEAFLDVSDLPDSGEVIARHLQERIRVETHLPCSLGVAGNKLVAKIATDVGKKQGSGETYPQAVTVVPLGEEEDFLAPLPVTMLWGVGKKTAPRLKGMGVERIGDLTKLPEQALAQVFGKNGSGLAQHARGRDEQPVIIEHEVKSISQEITFEQDITDIQRIKDTLHFMSGQVAYRLRHSGFCAATIRLKLRWADFTTLTRQLSMEQPVDQDDLIFVAAFGLFRKVWQPGNKVRLIGVGASGLVPRPQQLSLWDTPSQKERRLRTAIDRLRDKFGAQAITPGRTVRQVPKRKRQKP